MGRRRDADRVSGRALEGRGAVAPWSELRRRVPPGLRIPPWLGLALGGALAAGPLFGARAAGRPQRIVRSVFFSSAFGYLVTSLVDFAEHFRLEKLVTGRRLAAVVVPPGETLNHAATIATVVAALLAARRPAAHPTARDLLVLAAPGVFLALGWRDELRYHRKRATHREDIMHTTAHLAAGVMWTALYAMRLLDGGGRSPTTGSWSSSPAGDGASSSSGRSSPA